MKRQQFIIHGGRQRDAALAAVGAAKEGQVVTIATVSKTAQQNATIHMWYGEIAKQREGCTLLDIKGECHQKYGLPIRLSDPVFAWVWKNTGAKLDYEKQCAYLASEAIAVSSVMTKDELSSYMDQMSQEYRAEGYFLTDPELRKYEEA